MSAAFIFSLLIALPTQFSNSIDSSEGSDEHIEIQKSYSFMAYNVGNLFDTEDDPLRDDNEFTPGGSAKWTEEKLVQKMSNLAKVIVNSKSSSGKACPDFLGLVEVENAAIAQRFNREFLKECGYKKIVIDPKDPDPRGIRVASFTRLPLQGSPKSHSAYKDARFIQEVPLLLSGVPMTVFVNHWKSRRKNPENNDDGSEKRALSAQTLRNRVNEILALNPDAEILMLGDFNDEPENVSLKKVLGSTLSLRQFAEHTQEQLAWNPANELLRLQEASKDKTEVDRAEEFKKIRGTYYYAREKKYNLFDNAHMTAGLLDNQGIRYVPNSFKVVRLKEFTDSKMAPIPFSPPRQNGASDHFPILLSFTVLDPQ